MRITCGKCDDCIHQGVRKIRDENEVVGCAGDFMSVDEVVSALGKATPKKPGVVYDDCCCPHCGNVITFYDIDFLKQEFCCGCGQAIDWGGHRQ